MSTVRRGISDVQRYNAPVAAAIVSTTDASPIVVTTAAPHGLVDLDMVRILGHATNVTANGMSIAHVLSPTTLQLLVPRTRTNVGGAGAGAGGATGTVALVGWSSTGTLPDDGDAAAASSISAPIETTFDREANLAVNLSVASASFLPVIATADNGGPFNIAPWTTTNPVNVGWTEIAGVTAVLNDIHTLPGDDILVDFSANASFPAQSGGNPTRAAFALFAHSHEYGTVGSFLGGPASIITGSQIEMSYEANHKPIRLQGRLSAPGAHGKVVSLFLAASYDNVTGGPFPVFLTGSYTFKAVVMRKAF